jgi:HlyD family secretion protein
MYPIALGVLIIGCSSNSTSSEIQLRKASIVKGSIEETVNATGVVVPRERIALSFLQPGIVREVYVQVGDSVDMGQPLMALETGSLEISVRQAEVALREAQLNYDKLFAPPSPGELAGAYAAIAAASANYDRQTKEPDPEDVRIAQLQYDQAYTAYLKADIDLRGFQAWAPPILVDQYRAKFGQSLVSLESARIKLEQTRAGPDNPTIAGASAGVAEANARLNSLLAAPEQLQVARAQVQINQAMIGLERAKNALGNAVLLSPIAGQVSAVRLEPSDVATSGIVAIAIVDNAQMHVEVNVDELDIGNVKVGQPVQIALDALPTKTIESQVSLVSPVAQTSGGVVTYLVRIDLAANDLPVRGGMTATAGIVVRRIDNILLAPNWAIRIERSTGQAYASILNSQGKLEEIPVLIGIHGDQSSQVLAGLEEGQVVAINLSPDSISLFGAGQ